MPQEIKERENRERKEFVVLDPSTVASTHRIWKDPNRIDASFRD